MLTRAIFGAMYVAVIVGGIISGQVVFLFLLLLLSTLGVNEFLTMVNPAPESKQQGAIGLLLRALDCLGAAVLVVTIWSSPLFYSGPVSSAPYLGVFFPGMITYVLYLVMRLCTQLWITTQSPLRSLSTSMMSQLYVALPLALMCLIYRMSPELLLLLFVLVWVNDTFAYLCGRALGKHKLWERISPKKTWEGFWGGALFTVIVAALCGVYGPFDPLGVLPLALLGLVVSVTGTLGDLVESLLKRTVGVKDSGKIIPGHGGILDRIDSMLVVSPSALVYLFFVFVYAL